ncbi:hypothetical protein C882_0488 [Caenispirillum salinarum AK4]|uniref:DUF2336 domain-containing protein n=1 Tax=Caenispirillum salinarum AK4 TaxID=1238182 RepID=K9HKV2_9PROT|nr:DUF2336 domain-containing protein [Caenispirillum salinarum]EKV29181.1 hypothetical protein C882_0488 [Caenispirillum salinarum AK4]
MADQKLSAEDVNRLLADPSGLARAETADKLSRQFGELELTEAERQLAVDIFRIMVRDAEVRVREALATNLKENPLVPNDVAMSLARDVSSVAMPILEFSTVLTNEDLIEIVRSQDPDKQKAVARRKEVDAKVADELVERGDADVAATLAANQGADLTENAMLRMVDRFGDVEGVQDPLAHRARLPVTVAERLVTRVSETLRQHILENHELPADVAADLVLHSRERATINLSTESDEDEVERLVRQMQEHDRLTPSIILRAVCMGDIKFFEYALAVRTGIPIVNARELIHDNGDLGLKGIYGKAGLPQAFYPAIRAAVDVAAETDYDGEENDRERYSRRMIERVLTQYGDLGVDFESADLEYLLAKMNTLPPTLHAEG